MTGVTIVRREVDEYLAAVRDALADLPAAERDDLVAEVEASLADAAADAGRPLADAVGPPEDFAAELRAAAGLQETPAQGPARPGILSRIRALGDRIGSDARVTVVRAVATDLAPIWWVARAYLGVAALAYAVDAGWSSRHPLVPHIGSGTLGLAAIAAATVLSVALGLWGRRRRSPFPRLALAANVALVLAAIPVAAAVTETRAYEALVAQAYAPPPAPDETGLRYDGERVTNVYPFSRDGRLLHDVLLYDGAGRPLEISTHPSLDPHRRIPRSTGNRPLFNVFPIRYYEPGTRRVARPDAAPAIEVPSVRTRPVGARDRR